MLAHNVMIANLIDSAASSKTAVPKLEIKSNKPKASKYVDPEDVVRKELRQSVGRIDPLIKPPVEDILKTMKYKRMTKFDVMDETVNRIDKKVQALQDKRFESIQDPRKETRKNPILDLDPEVEYEDLLEEGEIRRAYEHKDVDKIELILLKSKARLEDYERKIYGDTQANLDLHQIEGLGKSTMSISMNRSMIGTLWDRAHADRNAPELEIYNRRSVSPSTRSKMENHVWNGYAKIDKDRTIPSHIYSEVSNNFNPGIARSEDSIVYRVRNPSPSPYLHQQVNIHPTGGSLGIHKVMKGSPHVRPYPGSQYLVEYEETGRGRNRSPLSVRSIHATPELSRSSRLEASPAQYKAKGSPYADSNSNSPYLTASTAVSQAFTLNHSGRY